MLERRVGHKSLGPPATACHGHGAFLRHIVEIGVMLKSCSVCPSRSRYTRFPNRYLADNAWSAQAQARAPNASLAGVPVATNGDFTSIKHAQRTRLLNNHAHLAGCARCKRKSARWRLVLCKSSAADPLTKMQAPPREEDPSARNADPRLEPPNVVISEAELKQVRVVCAENAAHRLPNSLLPSRAAQPQLEVVVSCEMRHISVSHDLPQNTIEFIGKKERHHRPEAYKAMTKTTAQHAYQGHQKAVETRSL